MKVTIDGITYEGTEDEIRRIVESPPKQKRPCMSVTIIGNPEYRNWPQPQKNWDGSPVVTCQAKGDAE